jgi:hypothetical protein
MPFAETVAVNRTLPVTVFSTVAEAENWLVDKGRGGADPHSTADADKPRH